MSPIDTFQLADSTANLKLELSMRHILKQAPQFVHRSAYDAQGCSGVLFFFLGRCIILLLLPLKSLQFLQLSLCSLALLSALRAPCPRPISRFNAMPWPS